MGDIVVTIDERQERLFVHASQVYRTESTRFVMSSAGVIGAIILIIGGVYFSKTFFSEFIGNSPLMEVISWGTAVVISSLEATFVTLIGNKITSHDIKKDNEFEFNTNLWITIALFIFDVFSNAYGIGIKIYDFTGAISTPAIVIMVVFSLLMGGSELLLIWMMRSWGTNEARYSSAKMVYDKFKEKMEEEASKVLDKNNLYNNNKPPQQQNNPPKNQNNNKQQFPGQNTQVNMNRQFQPQPPKGYNPLPPNYNNNKDDRYPDDNFINYNGR